MLGAFSLVGNFWFLTKYFDLVIALLIFRPALEQLAGEKYGLHGSIDDASVGDTLVYSAYHPYRAYYSFGFRPDMLVTTPFPKPDKHATYLDFARDNLKVPISFPDDPLLEVRMCAHPFCSISCLSQIYPRFHGQLFSPVLRSIRMPASTLSRK
jgi:hypothetical protein